MKGRKSKSITLYIKESGIKITPRQLTEAMEKKNLRTREIFILKERGETFEQIGNRYGITKQRVRFIIMKFIKGLK